MRKIDLNWSEGPWRVQDSTHSVPEIRDAGSNLIARLYGMDSGSNARLMALAPEMANLLFDWCRKCQFLQEKTPSCETCPTNSLFCKMIGFDNREKNNEQ